MPVNKTRTVFVVDDDLSARRALSRLLRTAGHDVHDFASAQDFLATLATDASGCVVLDVRMPGLTVEELVEEINARGVHLPIVVVTGDDDAETRSKAQRMKATAFFRKPVDGTALLDAIEWALRENNANGNHKRH
jgi:FixJ family two-component response regulator